MTETIIGAILALIAGALGMRLWSGHRRRERDAREAAAGYDRAKADEAREVTAARDVEAVTVARVEADRDQALEQDRDAKVARALEIARRRR